MTLQNDVELQNTRAKLVELESRCKALSNDNSEDAQVRQTTLRSLMRIVNQLKEEIARDEAHQPSQP
jgi:hypothetical protein